MATDLTARPRAALPSTGAIYCCCSLWRTRILPAGTSSYADGAALRTLPIPLVCGQVRADEFLMAIIANADCTLARQATAGSSLKFGSLRVLSLSSAPMRQVVCSTRFFGTLHRVLSSFCHWQAVRKETLLISHSFSGNWQCN